MPDAAQSRRVDAIILTGIVTEAATRDRLRCNAVAVIETWGLPEYPIDIAIGFSHHAAGVKMGRFLKGRGYRRPHCPRNDPRIARAANQLTAERRIDIGFRIIARESA